jgi:hypothetical protein
LAETTLAPSRAKANRHRHRRHKPPQENKGTTNPKSFCNISVELLQCMSPLRH